MSKTRNSTARKRKSAELLINPKKPKMTSYKQTKLKYFKKSDENKTEILCENSIKSKFSSPDKTEILQNISCNDLNEFAFDIQEEVKENE